MLFDCGREVVAMANRTNKWLLLSIWAVGCGGGAQAAPAASTANQVKAARESAGPINPVSKHGSRSVTATLGSGGGTLELDEGPRIVVPAGALKAGQDFVLELASKTTAFSNKESERALGPAFSFSPALDAPDGSMIEISFPLATVPQGYGEPSIAYEVQEGEAISYGEDSTRTRWEYERAALSGGRVVARLGAVNGLRLQFVLTNLEAQ
jgi:hypothetical protein